jgi:hypothetical protein
MTNGPAIQEKTDGSGVRLPVTRGGWDCGFFMESGGRSWALQGFMMKKGVTQRAQRGGHRARREAEECLGRWEAALHGFAPESEAPSAKIASPAVSPNGAGLRPSQCKVGECKMQNEPGGLGFSARCVPPSLAGLKPGEKGELHSLPGFRHAETLSDTECVFCVIACIMRKL